MDIKKLQKKVDQALSLLSDHDDKKNEERYHNLRNKIIETQDFIDNNNYSDEVSSELYHELKKFMKEFEEERFLFIIFLIILCGLLFIGVFYITYSHFYDVWHPHSGGNVRPPHQTKTSSTKETSVSTSTSTTKTTTSITHVVDPDDGDDKNAFVTVMFDNSSLIDLTNLYPVRDEIGLVSKPTTWSLSSQLIGASKDYIVKYTIDFVDSIRDIESSMLLDITKLKYSLIVKNKNAVVYDSGIQLMKDYPEIQNGTRNIITLETDGNTFKNGETLDFELRMWLDSATGNDQQGKKYKFNINVEAAYKFID